MELLTQKLTVFRRDHILEEKEWSKDLDEQPLSLAISQQGKKVAVGFVWGILVFDGAKDKCARLPTAIDKDFRAKSDVQKSQSLSFSVCGSHLVVATREAHGGKVFIAIHDLPPLKLNNERMQDLRLPTVCVPTSYYWLLSRSFAPLILHHRDTHGILACHPLCTTPDLAPSAFVLQRPSDTLGSLIE